MTLCGCLEASQAFLGFSSSVELNPSLFDVGSLLGLSLVLDFREGFV